jgi:hypothetical protein
MGKIEPGSNEHGDLLMTILDLLYQEYCRARLAEMRQQLLLRSPQKALLQDDDLANCSSLNDDTMARHHEGSIH